MIIDMKIKTILKNENAIAEDQEQLKLYIVNWLKYFRK